MPDDRETQPEAVLHFLFRPVFLHKTVEDKRKELLGDSFPGVRNPNGDVTGTCIALRMVGSGGSGTPVDNGYILIMEP